jgi:hypothetical protein
MVLGRGSQIFRVQVRVGIRLIIANVVVFLILFSDLLFLLNHILLAVSWWISLELRYELWAVAISITTLIKWSLAVSLMMTYFSFLYGDFCSDHPFLLLLIVVARDLFSLLHRNLWSLDIRHLNKHARMSWVKSYARPRGDLFSGILTNAGLLRNH